MVEGVFWGLTLGVTRSIVVHMGGGAFALRGRTLAPTPTIVPKILDFPILKIKLNRVVKSHPYRSQRIHSVWRGVVRFDA